MGAPSIAAPTWLLYKKGTMDPGNVLVVLLFIAQSLWRSSPPSFSGLGFSKMGQAHHLGILDPPSCLDPPSSWASSPPRPHACLPPKTSPLFSNQVSVSSFGNLTFFPHETCLCLPFWKSLPSLRSPRVNLPIS